MKKYLMTGVAALALCVGFTNCSNNDFETLSQSEIVQQKYEAAFIKAFGQPAANQTWGFGENATRSVIKTDMTGYPSATAPAPITQKEAEWVTKWFQNNPGLSEEGKPWKNFYVQFVSGDQNNKKGIWHRYDQNRPANEGKPANWDEEFTDNGGMDKLHVGATRDQASTDHLNDFNAKTGGPWDIVYVENGSALQFGYHSSWGEDSKAPNGDGYYWYFQMVELTVPGDCFSDGVARKGWYVGLSLYGKKYDNGDKELGFQRLQYAEDWILKVVPGEGEIVDDSYDGRIIAEDLNAGAEKSDFDFNDVVFDYKFVDASTMKIKLLAAGGTLPLRLNGDDVNYEVHKLFGVSEKTMVNTGAGATKDPVEFEIKGSFTQSLNGNDIKIEVKKGADEDENGGWIELTAKKAKAASKVRVDVDYEWCSERQDIDGKYFGADEPRFTQYVGGQWDWNTWYKRAMIADE
jgi:hypothetical protein